MAPQWTLDQCGIGLGDTHVLLPSSGYAGASVAAVAGEPARPAAGWPRFRAVGTEGVMGLDGGSARRLTATTGRSIDNRKQILQHTTRVNANGDGASGPEPEREQA